MIPKIEFKTEVVDTITNFRGIVTGYGEYISGCKKYLVEPIVGKDGAFRDGVWFDEERLEIVDNKKKGKKEKRDKRSIGGPGFNPPKS